MVSVKEALDYLQQGLSVIPLRPRDKKPSISSWAEFQKRRPTESEVAEWFKDGDKNIGIVCGKVSGGLLVVDFDDSEAIPYVVESLSELQKKTMVVRTGKGYHIYYKCKETPNLKLPNLKIDVKGEGGYVVAPPSVHPSGMQYSNVGSDKIKETIPKMVEYLKESDVEYPIAKTIAPFWVEGTHHERALRLSSLLKIRAKWPLDKIQRVILGVMRLRGDSNELEDRIRAITDGFEQEYQYDNLPKDLIEGVIRQIPVGDGDIWRLYYKGDAYSTNWKAFVCTQNGVYRHVHSEKEDDRGNVKETDDETRIFSEPLTLADAWHSEGDEENQVRFTFFLGKMKYTGTKVQVSSQIIESGLTGIEPNDIKKAVAACVEYYVSTKIVKVRESYSAIGVYEGKNGLEIALNDRDLSTERGKEPWYVVRAFENYDGNLVSDLEIFNRLWEFFDRDILALFYGFSAIAPFSYAMKRDGDYFWPLIITKGPRGTGKTTLGSLFTTFLYGVHEGGPSDVTSDYRLLDFLTGTTFPRLVDESENAKFEGQKFSIKISTTLKDAAQRQFVGSRGRLSSTNGVVKDLYAARTPIIMAGNKVDIEDPALLSRAIMAFFEIKDTKQTSTRRVFADEILRKLNKGFGVRLTEFAVAKYGSYRTLLFNIRERKIDYQFSDPRREDFYASFYEGLLLWKEFFEAYGVDFALKDYLDEDKFLSFVKRFEEFNAEESQERQSIQVLIDWAKTKVDVLNGIEGETNKPATYYELKSMIKQDKESGVEFIYVTQAALNLFCRDFPSFMEKSLSEVADSLSKFYGVDRSRFYPRSGKSIGSRTRKVVKIPVEGVGIGDYEADSGEDPPDNDSNQRLGLVREVVRTEKPPMDSVSAQNLTNNQKVGVFSENNLDETRTELSENNKNHGDMVRNVVENKDNTDSMNLTNRLTNSNQRLGVPVSFRVLKQFSDGGLIYSPGNKFHNWNLLDPMVGKWLKQGRIEQVMESEISVEQLIKNAEKRWTH